MTSPKGLNIGHVNVYHLGNKTHDICRLLDDNGLHVLGLTETRLNLQPDEQIAISGYTFFRKDKEKTGQHGLGIYISDNVLNYIIRRKDLESENMETIWIEFRKCPKDTPLLISFMYRNGASDFTWYDDFFSMMINAYNKHPNANILLLGDFNLDLLKPHIPWHSTFSQFGLKQLVDKPTRIAKKGDSISSTLLDHIYSNDSNRVSNLNLSKIRISDHTATTCTWSCKNIRPPGQEQNHTTIEYRCFKKFNPDLFLFELSQTNFSKIYQSQDADSALEAWYNIYTPILDKHAPIRRKRVKQRRHNAALTPEIRDAMKARDKLFDDGNHNDYKKMRNKVNEMLRQSESDLIKSKVEKRSNTKELWNIMNFITHKSRKAKLLNKIIATSDEFNNYFLSVAANASLENIPTSADPDYTKIRDFCSSRMQTNESCSIPEMTVFEVGKLLSNLPSKKSTGLDNISPFFLKLSMPYIVEHLTFIYNKCITTNTFPKIWKSAKVIPIPKVKECTEFKHFRPISLLSVLSKPLEKHIHSSLYQYIEKNNLFHSLQSGFREGHSCNTALTHMNDTWLSSINNSELNGLIFIDFQKAFDLVNHEILLQKLLIYTRNANTTDLIFSFLDHRSQSVCLNGTLSKVGSIFKGVPQGSILGPLLFCLFINDLPLHISNPSVQCYLFADDGSLSASAKTTQELEILLQEEMNNIMQWSSSNHMIIHPGKTKSMVITTRQKHQIQPLKIKVHIGQDTIEQVDHHKVLGVILDEELRWERHIDSIASKISRNLYLLFKLKPYMDTVSMKTFYYAHCLSHMNYCSNVWGNAKQVYIKKLSRLHRRAANLLLPVPSLSTDDKLMKLDILPLNKQIDFNILITTYKSLHTDAPPYLQNLLQSNMRSHRLVIPKPRIDIYKSSLTFQGPSLWNSLPLDIRASTSLSSFKQKLRKFLLH